jgi:exonuclease III
MVNSGQIHLISDSFPPLPPPPFLMKIISWNIRGLKGHSKQRLLRDMLIAEKPDILLLQETKCDIEEMEKILPSCWKQGRGTYTTAMGAAGGLALFWNPSSITLDNFFTTKWSITVGYRLIGSNKPGYLTNVYGPANSRDKQAFLRSLEHQATIIAGNRWILGGDFNMICNLDEKRGGTRGSKGIRSTFSAKLTILAL